MIVKMMDNIRMRELAKLVKSTGLDSVRMVEVGCYAGESADVFASIPEVNEIWCIDPWLNGYDGSDIASSSDMEGAERMFDEVAKQHVGKIHKFKGTLGMFINSVGGKFDLVYIDADHRYESVKDDILLSAALSPKFIAGHDYINQYRGVVDAVNEIFSKPDFVFYDCSWIKKVG